MADGGGREQGRMGKTEQGLGEDEGEGGDGERERERGMEWERIHQAGLDL